MRLGPNGGSEPGLALTPPAKSDASRIDAAARGLEANFARLLISSMRSASLGDDAMFPGAASQYRDLYDRELAEQITRGRGLGLAPMIRRQLGSEGLAELPPQSRKWFALDPAARPAMALPAPTRTPLPASSPEPAAAVGAHRDASVRKAYELGRAAASCAGDAALPVTTDAAAPAGPSDASGSEAFVARLWPHAQRAARELGVCPRTLLAQAALETGWGRHTLRTAEGGSANNFFGIKAGGSWRGGTVNAGTTEFVDGSARAEQARFRAYDDAAASFDDYVALIKHSPRYAAARAAGADGPRFAQELQRAGYATDPQYAAKIAAIAEGPTLRRALQALPEPRADA